MGLWHVLKHLIVGDNEHLPSHPYAPPEDQGSEGDITVLFPYTNQDNMQHQKEGNPEIVGTFDTDQEMTEVQRTLLQDNRPRSFWRDFFGLD